MNVRAGESWDPFVASCVEQGWAGLECLSGIPGHVGATPIQNVGAYGQEVSGTLLRVDVYDRVLDKLVIPGYSSIGPFLRKHWWPVDPAPFTRPVDIVVTGGSSGIGAATAAGLTALGARVHLVGRTAQRLQVSASKIRLQQPDAELFVHECDISDLDSVRTLIDELTGELEALHGLVHCAGIMPPERKETKQGHEQAFATHILGPFLLTVGLRPLLQADGDGRVVFVSSGGMYTSGLETDLESWIA